MSIYFSSRALNYSSFCVSVSCLLFLWHAARKERNLAAKDLPLTLNRKIWEGEVDRASQDITRPTWPWGHAVQLRRGGYGDGGGGLGYCEYPCAPGGTGLGAERRLELIIS